MIKRKIFIILLLNVFFIYAEGQEVIDRIVAVVGDEIILKSDIESQRIQLIAQGHVFLETDEKCDILEEMLFQKLLLNQALADSLEITRSEVENELNRRLNVFINQYGSERQLEDVYGKSVREIKEDFRDIIKEQILIQRMQMKLIEHINITPAEVRAFYNSIPTDSLPIIEAYYEYSELIVEPEIGQEQINETVSKLEDLRQRVIDGERFQTLAIIHSEDQSSAVRGGELGFFSREDMVPEFSAAAFRLVNPGDVSRVVKTEFGYHIIQLIERRGGMVNVRHILMSPSVSDEQLEIAEKKITHISKKILTDSISFNEAVQQYSQGESKFNNGAVLNPRTGDRKNPVDMVDPRTQRILNRLQAGEISEPFLGTNMKGQRVFKILRLDKKEDAHVACIDRDYREIKEYAMHMAQQDYIFDWIKEALEKFYIRIDESYANCKFNYVDWINKTN